MILCSIYILEKVSSMEKSIILVLLIHASTVLSSEKSGKGGSLMRHDDHRVFFSTYLFSP